MNFNKTTSYALNVLSYMAEKPEDMYSAKQLHEHLNIPYPYLRQLLTDLSKAGFIKSIQGRYGGFVFAKNIKKISVGDVVNAMEGIEIFSNCIIGFKECPFDMPCALHESWEKSRKQITDILRKTTLADFKNKNTKK